ncbi:MAG: histidinol-phosphatase HisJ family protein [Bacteroidales bacterium]|nr:histidinol-phosphatase HisJ family protein [Bacteroidales bacterium]
MVLFDNHNHSQFSFDGQRTSVEASARAALSAGLGGICFSDHCDHYVPPMKASFEDLKPEYFDVAEQQEEIGRVQDLLGEGVKILKGIEIGMYEECHEQIRNVLSSNSFDQVLASVHYIQQTDPYYGGYYEGKDWKQAYGGYLETIYREMTRLGDFDIMGHYDYIVRYAPYPVTSIRYRDFSDIFDEMFRYLINEGKALEINTKSYEGHRGRIVELDHNVLLRYREMGGEIISLGSDSHEPSRVGAGFTFHAELLKSLGFRWTAHYEQRRLVQLSL